MAQLHLYYDMLSQPSRSLYVFFKIAGISFQGHKLSIISGEHQTPEYSTVNPRKKLPALTDGDFHLSESVAMVRYIANKYRGQIADHWYPKDPKAQARVDEFLAYQHLGTRLHYSLLFIHGISGMRTGKTPDPKKTEELDKNRRKITHIIQKTFLGDKQFLCSNEISVADIFAAQEILQIVGSGTAEPLKDFPKLAAWMERVSHKCNPYFAESLEYLYSFGGFEIPAQYKSKY